MNRLDISRCLSVKDIAEILNVSVDVIYRIIHSNTGFPFFKVGRQFRIPAEAFVEWIRENLINKGV